MAEQEQASTTLTLPARVDVGSVARLYREWAPRSAKLRLIDLSAVEHIDSAGVALLAALQAEARRRGAPAPQVKSPPARFANLCQAHRVGFDLPERQDAAPPRARDRD